MENSTNTAIAVDAALRIAEIHPALTALETTTAAQEKLVKAAAVANQKGCNLYAQVNPTAWTERIEDARDAPEKLADIRRTYDALVLEFMGAWLEWSRSNAKMMKGRIAISHLIEDAVSAYKALGKQPSSEPLRAVFQSRLLSAAEIHARDPSMKPAQHCLTVLSGLYFHDASDHYRLEVSSDFLTRAHNIQASAFRAIKPEVFERGTAEVYPTAPAVPDTSAAGLIREIRHLNVIEFVECGGEPHPASAHLCELVTLILASIQDCFDADKVFTGEQKGNVNERQHANRMIDFLYEDTNTSVPCGGTLNNQIDAQNQRRYDFEMHRQQLALGTTRLKKLLVALVETLGKSVVETESLLQDVEKTKHATIDRIETVRIMMNNCLAVDASLRYWVTQLQKFEQKVKADISNGAGRRVVEEAFNIVLKRYSRQQTPRE